MQSNNNEPLMMNEGLAFADEEEGQQQSVVVPIDAVCTRLDDVTGDDDRSQPVPKATDAQDETDTGNAQQDNEDHQKQNQETNEKAKSREAAATQQQQQQQQQQAALDSKVKEKEKSRYYDQFDGSIVDFQEKQKIRYGELMRFAKTGGSSMSLHAHDEHDSNLNAAARSNGGLAGLDNDWQVPLTELLAGTVPLQRLSTPNPGAMAVYGSNFASSQSSQDDGGATTDFSDEEDGPPSPPPQDDGLMIQAYTVEEQQLNEISPNLRAELESQVRQTILQDVVQANVVSQRSLESAQNKKKTQQQQPEHDQNSNRRRKLIFCAIGGLLLGVGAAAALGLFIGVGGGDTSESDSESSSSKEEAATTTETVGSISTLDIIRDRGYVKCGTYVASHGFSTPNPLTGNLEGINADQCRAIAIALFGKPSAVEFVRVDPPNRFEFLANQTIDVIATTATHNFQRDVYYGKSTNNSGFTFSIPYVYSGLNFWGAEEFVECAEALDAETGICTNLTVCVGAFTTFDFLLRTLLPHKAIVPVGSPEELVSYVDDGTCKTVAAEIFHTHSRAPAGTKAGTKLFSKEPLSLVTREEEDTEFSSIVNAVVNVFFLAEAHGITKSNAYELESLVGPDLAPTLIPVVAEFGNYNDLYETHLEALVPRHGLNTIYDSQKDNSGLLYPFPLGFATSKGPSPDPNGMIATIRNRGVLRCGVVDRGGPTYYTDFDTEFCRAISAGLFHGSTVEVGVTVLATEEEAFAALQGGDVDVVAGMRLQMLATIAEPSTGGQRYALSMPYYYDKDALQAYGFATRTEDPKWSDLVNWVAMATVHASDVGLGMDTALDMPEVNLFGDDLNLFQDVVMGVGSYNELYARTLEFHIPQVGSGNEINYNLTGPQQFPLPFL